MIRLAAGPNIRVVMDTNVWLAAVRNGLFDDILRLGEHPRVSWLFPWEPGLRKDAQIMVRELLGARDRDQERIATLVHANRILRQAAQILINQPESDRFYDLYRRFTGDAPSRLEFSHQLFSAHQPQEGEIIAIVCAEREDAILCSEDDAARRFARTILPYDNVVSMSPLFSIIEKSGIDLPGKLRAGHA